MNGSELMVPAFREFYRHIVPEVAGTTARNASAVTAPQALPAVLDTIHADLLRMVERQSYRALIGEFHAFRADLGTPSSGAGDQALRRFGDHLADPAHCAQILHRHPVLQTRLATMVRGSLTAYAELFAAYRDDRDELRSAGLLETDGDQLLESVHATGSDLHNDSRQVIRVRTTGGARLVYKPRDLASDEFVRELYAAAEPYLKFSLRGCLPRSVSVGSHGWQEFVTTGPMTSPDQPARYFYRFGAICAILGAIGASDLHDENVLAHGEHPSVIDTETMVRPDAGVLDESLPNLLLNHLKLSVATTMLVPMKNPTSPIDVMMAGVGVAQEQTSTLRRSVVRNASSDEIAVGWEPVVYRHGSNVPRLGDEAVSAAQFYGDVVAGYLDGLGFVRGAEISEVLDAHSDMTVRCLLRSTYVYGKFGDASTHPDYLTRPEEARRLFDLLGHYPDYLSVDEVEYVGSAERTALEVGNVPHFVARADTTELATPRSRMPGVYRVAPLDFARRGVALNAARSDEYHQLMLEECLSELVGVEDRTGLCRDSVFALPAAAGIEPGSWWPSIARTLTRAAVEFGSPRGPELGWICGIGPDRGAPTVTPGNYVSFHDGGGIPTFLRRAADAGADADLGRAACAAERGLATLATDYSDLLTSMPESILTGASSLLLAQPGREDPAWLDDIVERIGERAASGVVETDLANGPAGLLMVLLSRAEAGRRSVGDVALARLRDLTLDHLPMPRSTDWSDVAHGELGLRWACSRIARMQGDRRLADESADWLIGRLTADGFACAGRTGWCNGAAGLLVTAAEILTTAGRQDWFDGGRLAAVVAAATRLPTDRPIDLSVCHGSSGVVQSLLAAGRILDDAALYETARQYQERVLDCIRRTGFHTGARGRTALPGYLLGWAGIGDSDLLLHSFGSFSRQVDVRPVATPPFIPIAFA